MGTMEDFKKEIFEDLRVQLSKPKFPKIKMSYKNFIELLSVQYQLNEAYLFKETLLVIDSYNINQMQLLYDWMCGDLKNNKGILFVGGYGTGKTSVTRAFLSLYNRMTGVLINYFEALKLHESLKSDYDFKKSITLINDIGKENPEVVDYGNRTDVVCNFLQIMNEKNCTLFATSNLSFETLKKRYSGTVADRLKSIFYICEVKGNSRR
jgi:DNA replication protein DnaC